MLLLGTAVARPAASGPRISFANPIYEFGTVNAGKTYDHRYWFTNTGDQTLQITNVHSTCGCTTLEDWPKTVEAGDSGSIGIQFNSSRVSGNIQKSVVVYSTDSQYPITELTVKGRVGNPIEFSPKWAYFNIAAGTNAPPSQFVSLTNSARQPLALFDPRSTNAAFSARVLTNRPGVEYRIEIAAVRPLPMGITRGEISVRTSSPDLPLIKIPTMVNVQSPLTVMPAEVTLPSSPLANAVTNTVIVQYTGQGSLALSDARISNAGPSIQVRPLQPGRIFQVLLGFPSSFTANADCQLIVNTTDPQHPLLKVPIVHAQSGAN